MRIGLTAISVVILAVATSVRVGAQEPKSATFAGGCFWCVESDFDNVPGVLRTTSGYTGGITPTPTYEEVSSGRTRHREAVQITYDPTQVSYEELLTVFWHSVDPTDPGGQFCDRGRSYETAIFVSDEQQRRLAEASKQAAEAELKTMVVTPIEEATPFFPAERYHQDYYKKNPLRYQFYRWSCGRNQRVKEIWGDTAYKGIPAHG